MLTSFPWQQLLRERASMLRYTYISGLVITYWMKKNCTYVNLEWLNYKQHEQLIHASVKSFKPEHSH